MADDELILELAHHLRATEGVQELDYTFADYLDPEILRRLSAMDDDTWELTIQISDHQVRITQEGHLYIDGQLRTRDFLSPPVYTDE